MVVTNNCEEEGEEADSSPNSQEVGKRRWLSNDKYGHMSFLFEKVQNWWEPLAC